MNSIARDQFPNLKLHGEYAELTLDERKIAVTHYPFYAQALARTGDYDAVFSGHIHQVTEERFGDCLWVNPGEVLGAFGPSTCAIYDTERHSAEIITL
jgi:predicted phosphodiesterase